MALALALLALVVAPHPLGAGLGRWTAIGPDGGTVTALVAHPQLAGTFYAGTRNTGVFVTADGGANWAAANAGIATALVFDLAIDPRQPATLYAGTPAGLFVSHNGGRLWTRTFPAAARALAVSTSGRAIVYAAQANVVWRSEDGGATWVERGRLGRTQAVFDLLVHPRRPETVLAGTTLGVAITDDGGASWRPANDGFGARPPVVHEIAVAPTDPSVLYAATAGTGVWTSVDGGHTWSPLLSEQLGEEDVVDAQAVAVDPRTPSILYAGINRQPLGREFSGEVWRSRDGGASWSRAYAGAFVHHLAVAVNGGQVLAGVTGRAVVATNGRGAFFEARRGLRAAGIPAVAADPFRPGRLLAAATVGGEGEFGAARLLRSTNFGATWTEADLATVVSTGAPAIQSVAFDPRQPDRVYAAGAEVVLRSGNGGASWRATRIVGIFDDVAAVSGRAYAVGFVLGPCDIPFCGLVAHPVVAISSDSGASWTLREHEVEAATSSYVGLEAVAVDPRQPQRAWVATGQRVATTSDGGATWAARGAPPGGVNDLQTSLHEPGLLYAGGLGADDAGGIWLSRDGAGSWSNAGKGMPPGTRVLQVAEDPNRQGRLFAATETGVFLSDNGAASWRRLGVALTGRRVVALSFDPATRTLYAGTLGGPGLFAYTLLP